ncbi:ATP-grasp domain-containing protein [Paraflavitalea pollutisoli]|uniref:ATP-grasp domain-containing protein n=1 Tax=Paraflavitalea pollutisoli TaxID=3034143 RepID=UPI0023ED3F54|nr:ATP-grasp domain-containing protein [Paraflavitalea sp. H1-2-19X]
MNTNRILVIPEKTDIEFEEVLAVWTAAGGAVKRLGKYWIRDEELTGRSIALYGNQTFALVLAQIYDVDLLSPDDTLIARLDQEWTKRKITLTQIAEAGNISFPVFAKPVIPKLFLAGVFADHAAFAAATNGLQSTEEVLVSEVVDDIVAEARSYVREGTIKDLALYEGEADLAEASLFLAAFLKKNSQQLPAVVVIDLAYCSTRGWFVLEFNACWGAGLNHCKASNVIDCIIEATVNKE